VFFGGRGPKGAGVARCARSTDCAVGIIKIWSGREMVVESGFARPTASSSAKIRERVKVASGTSRWLRTGVGKDYRAPIHHSFANKGQKAALDEEKERKEPRAHHSVHTNAQCNVSPQESKSAFQKEEEAKSSAPLSWEWKDLRHVRRIRENNGTLVEIYQLVSPKQLFVVKKFGDLEDFDAETLVYQSLKREGLEDISVKFLKKGVLPNGTGFVVMEFLKNGDLIDFLSTRQFIEDPLEILKQMTVLVKLLHRLQMSHLDIKPGNFLVKDDGRVVLTDFSNCRMWGEEFAYAEYYDYDSGEIEVTPHRDIFALGRSFQCLSSDSHFKQWKDRLEELALRMMRDKSITLVEVFGEICKF
jgi:serine/threonine protein kinase